MKETVTPIRELSLIEEELNSRKTGILTYINPDGESLSQRVLPYVYFDKNIYFHSISPSDSADKSNRDLTVSFRTLRELKLEKKEGVDFPPSYRLFTIACLGTLRLVEDNKVITDLGNKFFQKYAREFDTSLFEKEENKNLVFLMLDIKEINASEITGGM